MAAAGWYAARHSLGAEVDFRNALGGFYVRPYRRPFKELCGMIKDDADYIQFLRTLMATHCNLMLNLYKMIQWHEQPLYAGA